MNKKKAILLLVSMFLLIIVSSVVVHAQEERKFTDVLAKMGQFIFKDLPGMGDYGFKFLLWIALFAIIDWGLRKGDFEKKTANIVSLIISLATVILVPGRLITFIFRLYGNIIILALGIFVPLLLLWVIHNKFKDGRVAAFLRGSAYFIIGYALWNFAWYVTGVRGEAAEFFMGWASMMGWIQLVGTFFIVLGAFNFLMGFTGEEVMGEFAGKVREIGETDVGKPGKKLYDAAKKKWHRGEAKVLRNFVREKEELKRIEKVREWLKDLQRLVKKTLDDEYVRYSDTRKGSAELVRVAGKLKDALEDAKGYFSALSRSSYREKVGVERVAKKLNKLGISTSDIEALVDDVLKLHDEASKELKDTDKKMGVVEEILGAINDYCKGRGGATVRVDIEEPIIKPGKGQTKIRALLTEVTTNLGLMEPKVKEAEKREELVMTHLRDLLTRVEKDIEEAVVKE
ncbi:hypothetical protein KY332_04045 [Candidatus Woesearchaeota archaeon]|nr:hypothetical protein [Candidatus Woesearchaeota archaeon]